MKARVLSRLQPGTAEESRINLEAFCIVKDLVNLQRSSLVYHVSLVKKNPLEVYIPEYSFPLFHLLLGFIYRDILCKGFIACVSFQGWAH